jgi:hypothetical protein
VSDELVYAAGGGVGGNLVAFDVTRPLVTGEFTWRVQGDGDFQALMVRGDKVFAGGHFDDIGGQVRHKLVAVDADTGALDPGWTPSIAGSQEIGVWSITGTSGPRLYAGGDFVKVGTAAQQGFAQFTDSDVTRPEVVGVTPQDGTNGAPAATDATATFSEAMDPATIGAGAFTLTKKGATTTVPATVNYDPATRKATLDPKADLEADASYTATIRGGANGVRDVAGNVLAADEAWSFSTPDTSPPETTIDSGPSGTLRSATASFAFSSSEAGSTFECSLDGAPFGSCASPKDYAGLADGPHTFEVRAVDAAGNADVTPASSSWSVDATAPSVQQPEQSFPSGITLSTITIPVKPSWSATDADSGVSRYELQQSTNGGPYANVSLPTPTTTTSTRFLAPGNSYQFRVRAQDGAGNWSAWAAGPQFFATAHQEGSGAISYAGPWAQESSGSAYGGGVAYTQAKGAKAEFAFTGRDVAWVATKGPDRGKAEVWVDGVKAKGVDLYAPAQAPRKTVFSQHWADPGAHTVEVRVLGTKNASSTGTRVDLDALIVLSD